MATPVTLRSTKGSALTWTEQDGNTTALRNAIDSTITTYGASIASLQAGQSNGTLGFTTKALMDANLTPAANSLAIVTNDATSTNNTYWIKIGASGSGSWQKSNLAAQVPFVNASLYSDFATAVSSQGTNQTTLVISTSMSVTTVVNVPTNVKLLFIGSGCLNISGAGSVTGLPEARPENFGINTTPGTTDMTAATQYATAAVTNGKVIFTGTYYITGTVQGRDGVDFVGNNASIIKTTNHVFQYQATLSPVSVTSITSTISTDASLGHTEVILVVSDVSSFAVGDKVVLYGDSLQSFFSTITSISSNNITLSGRLTFTIGTNPKLAKMIAVKSTLSGIKFTGGSGTAVTIARPVCGVTIDNCQFVGTSTTAIDGIDYTTAWIDIKNCIFDWNGFAITPYDAGPSTIEKCYITNTSNAIRSVRSHNVNIVSCKIENGSNQSYGCGIDLIGSDGTGGPQDKNCFNLVSGCEITNQVHGIPGSAVGGIHLNFNSNYNIITGNKSQRNSIGIYLENSNNYNIISNNHCDYNDGYYGCGIQLDWDNTHNTISNNSCNYNTGSNTAAEGVGIEMRGGVGDHDNVGNIFTGNVCKFNSVFGAVITSTGTIFEGNSLSDNGSDLTQTKRGALHVHNATGVNVSSNNIKNNIYDNRSSSSFNSNALLIEDSSNSLFSANTIENEYWSSNAVLVRGSISALAIGPNFIRNDATASSAIQLTGISGTPLTNIQVSGVISSVSNGRQAIIGTYITAYDITTAKLIRTTTTSFTNSTVW